MQRWFAWLAAAVLASAACTAIVETDDLNEDTHKPADTGVDAEVDTAIVADTASPDTFVDSAMMVDSVIPADTSDADTSPADTKPVDMGPETPADCTARLYGGHSYLHCAATTTWLNADAKCRALGMRLAKVDNVGEQSAMISWISANKAWIDGTDNVTEGTWIWSYDGAAFGYSAWASGEPNEMCSLGECDHLVITKDGWEDGDARSLFGAICEEP